MKFIKRLLCTDNRFLTIVSLFIIVPIGFYSKFYKGPAASWVNNSLGGTFYEIFWCLLSFLIFNKSKPWIVATIVLIITCLLEFLQLWQPYFLQVIRRTFIGATILGNSFTWADFPYYFIGSGVGWYWLKWLNKHPAFCVKQRN